MRTILTVVAVLALLGPFAPADEIVLRGGTVVRGTTRDVPGIGTRVVRPDGSRLFLLEREIESIRADGEKRSGFIRYRNQTGLETLTRFYLHGPTGTVVALVGVIHVADPEYYHRLQDLLDAHEVVLFEGVGGARTEDLEFIGRLQLELGGLLGLTFQKDVIDYDRESWKNADMSWEEVRRSLEERGQELIPNLELVRRIAPALMGFAQTQKSRLDSTARRGFEVGMKRMVGGLLGNSDGLFARFGLYDQKNRDDVLISLRNDRAIRVLTDALKGKHGSIAVFYGAGHLTDMEARLEVDQGCELVGERWDTAWSVGNETE